jgi:hypothetical protein
MGKGGSVALVLVWALGVLAHWRVSLNQTDSSWTPAAATDRGSEGQEAPSYARRLGGWAS